jgi:hypothetical protein
VIIDCGAAPARCSVAVMVASRSPSAVSTSTASLSRRRYARRAHDGRHCLRLGRRQPDAASRAVCLSMTTLLLDQTDVPLRQSGPAGRSALNPPHETHHSRAFGSDSAPPTPDTTARTSMSRDVQFLITQRSQVQILSPLLLKTASDKENMLRVVLHCTVRAIFVQSQRGRSIPRLMCSPGSCLAIEFR